MEEQEEDEIDMDDMMGEGEDSEDEDQEGQESKQGTTGRQGAGLEFLVGLDAKTLSRFVVYHSDSAERLTFLSIKVEERDG